MNWGYGQLCDQTAPTIQHASKPVGHFVVCTAVIMDGWEAVSRYHLWERGKKYTEAEIYQN